jgi:hypothetical protein
VGVESATTSMPAAQTILVRVKIFFCPPHLRLFLPDGRGDASTQKQFT